MFTAILFTNLLKALLVCFPFNLASFSKAVATALTFTNSAVVYLATVESVTVIGEPTIISPPNFSAVLL